MVPISYNLRNLAVRKATTAAAAGGLALVVLVFSLALMLGNGIEKTMGRAGAEDVAVIMRKGSDAELSSPLDESTVNLVLATPGVSQDWSLGGKQAAQPPSPVGIGEIVVVILLDKLGTDGFSNVTVRGVPDKVMAFRPSVKIVEGRAAQPGSDEVVVGKAIRGRFKGVDLGQSFELKKNRPVKVVGVFEDGGSAFESEVWADIQAVRAAFNREGNVSSARVKLESAAKFDAFKAAVESNKQLMVEATRETVFYEKQSQGTSIFVKALGFTLAFFVAVGAMIGAMITMHASIAQRRREIGTLRALGFSRIAIMASFLFESLVLALLGGVVGVLAALPFSFVKFATMNFATWSEIVFTFEPTPQILIASVVAAGFLGILGGFLPALRAARMSPIQAMRNA